MGVGRAAAEESEDAGLKKRKRQTSSSSRASGKRRHGETVEISSDDDEVIASRRRNVQPFCVSSDSEEEMSQTSNDGDADDSDVKSQFWRIKCKKKHEEAAAMAIREKCRHTTGLAKSAIAPVFREGFVIIESDTEEHARRACKGVDLLKPTSIAMISKKEVQQILDDRKDAPFKEKDWVVIKAPGMYKGDVGEVLEVKVLDEQVVVKLIPRENIHESKNAKNQIWPQKLISAEELEKASIQVKYKRDERGRKIYIAKRMQFWDGYLLKPISWKNLEHASESEVEELRKFMTKIPVPAPVPSKHGANFTKGDKIVVAEGKFKGTIGQVARVDGDNIFFKAKRGFFQLNKNSLSRHFENGDHVRVSSGVHEGTTGMVVDVEGENVIVNSDASKENIRVPKEHLEERTDSAPIRSKLGDYELLDLVSLNHAAAFGMIVNVDKNALKILLGVPRKLEVLTIKPKDVQNKIFDKNAIAQDSARKAIRLKATVRVEEGPFRGKQGVVEHIHGGLVFIHDKQFRENGGYLCARAGSCLLLNEEGIMPSMLKATPNPDAAPRRVRHVLTGKHVKVKKGPFKGLRGQVVIGFNKVVRVFLEALLKEVTVQEDQVAPVDTPAVAGDDAPMGDGVKGSDGWGGSAAAEENGGGWGTEAAGVDGWGNDKAGNNEEKSADAGWAEDGQENTGGWGAGEANAAGWAHGGEENVGGWGAGEANVAGCGV